MQADKATGIILAGGRSTRMGRNKALLPIAGKPLVRHLAEGMLALGIARIVVACGPEARGPEYGALLRDLPGDVVMAADHYPDCGPLAGLHAALSAMPEPGGYGFVMACDMPVIAVTLFERMLQAAVNSGAVELKAESIDGPGQAGSGGHASSSRDASSSQDASLLPQLIRTARQPFHALYHASAVGEIERRLERGDLRVMPLLGALRSVELAPTAEEEEAFVNLNTPELYEQYIVLGGKHS